MARAGKIECVRCGKEFSPSTPDRTMCSQCTRHVRAGGPVVMDRSLSFNRKMQKIAEPGKRWCSGCQKYRAEKFFGSNKEGFYSRCKPCHREQVRSAGLIRNYNITAAQYDEIKEEQGGKCAICQKATGASKSLAVDHDHSCCPQAGKSCGNCIRGVLCSSCNKLLGFAGDNPEFFLRAVEYLNDPPAQRIIGKVKPNV